MKGRELFAMISFLSGWIEQLALAVIITSIFEMILPRGNLSKYIKMVLGIYIVFNLISPFVNKNSLYSFGDFDLDKYVGNSSPNNNVNQESMDLRIKNLYIEQIEENIKSKVDEFGFKAERCKVDANFNSGSENAGINRIDLILREKQNEKDVEKVQVDEIVVSKLLKLKENKDDERINDIKKKLAEYYEIDESIINIRIK